MTAPYGAAGLRHGLVDYRLTTIGCNPGGTALPELVEVADQKSVDAFEDLTDDELLRELSGRLG